MGYREVESREFAVTQDTGIEALLAYIGLSEVNHIRLFVGRSLPTAIITVCAATDRVWGDHSAMAGQG